MMFGLESTYPYPLGYFEIIGRVVKEFFSPIGEPLSTTLTPYYDKAIHFGVTKIGLPVDQVIFVFLLFSTFPLTFLYRLLPQNTTIKHLYNLIIGLLFGFLCFGYDCLHLLILPLVSYILLCTVKHGISHKIVFVWCFGYLSVT
jgi:hypothetical protein